MPPGEPLDPDHGARRGPVFIIGAMGSGTTLLRVVLDSHPAIAIPRETGFMRTYDAHRFVPFKFSGRNWFKRLGWSEDEFDEVMRDLYDRLFMRYAERHGKQRWGDKTPLHTWHVDDLARVFPDAQFVAVVRHPSASVASNMTRFGMRRSRAASHWSRYVAEIARQAVRYGDRFALLRYEDFVLRPEPVMRELLAWLGEPWSDVVLEHHEVQGARSGRKRVSGKSRTDDPIDVSRIDKWTRTLGGEDRTWLAERLSGRAGLFGYSMAGAELDPLAGGAAILLGTGVAQRADAFGDLDLETRGAVPRYDQLYDPKRFMMLALEQYDALTRPRGMRSRLRGALPAPVRRRLGVREPRRPRLLD